MPSLPDTSDYYSDQAILNRMLLRNARDLNNLLDCMDWPPFNVEHAAVVTATRHAFKMAQAACKAAGLPVPGDTTPELENYERNADKHGQPLEGVRS